jgi:hypothetical protein
MTPKTLKRYNSKWPARKIYFNLDLFLTKCIRILSCKRFFSRKCCFRRFFNKKLRASTYIWWCFYVFQPAGSHTVYDFQATKRSAPGGASTLTESPFFFLLFTWESYLTPSRMAMPFFIAIRIRVNGKKDQVRKRLQSTDLVFWYYNI